MKVIKLTGLLVGIAFMCSCNSNAQTSQRGQGGQGGDRQGPPSADEIFEKMDADNNNLLELDEIKGPLKNDFSKVDADSDGYISREELENAPKPERGGGDRGPR